MPLATQLGQLGLNWDVALEWPQPGRLEMPRSKRTSWVWLCSTVGLDQAGRMNSARLVE
jgi:hypothetical protein